MSPPIPGATSPDTDTGAGPASQSSGRRPIGSWAGEGSDDVREAGTVGEGRAPGCALGDATWASAHAVRNGTTTSRATAISPFMPPLHRYGRRGSPRDRGATDAGGTDREGACFAHAHQARPARPDPAGRARVRGGACASWRWLGAAARAWDRWLGPDRWKAGRGSRGRRP